MLNPCSYFRSGSRGFSENGLTRANPIISEPKELTSVGGALCTVIQRIETPPIPTSCIGPAHSNDSGGQPMLTSSRIQSLAVLAIAWILLAPRTSSAIPAFCTIRPANDVSRETQPKPSVVQVPDTPLVLADGTVLASAQRFGKPGSITALGAGYYAPSLMLPHKKKSKSSFLPVALGLGAVGAIVAFADWGGSGSSHDPYAGGVATESTPSVAGGSPVDPIAPGLPAITLPTTPALPTHGIHPGNQGGNGNQGNGQGNQGENGQGENGNGGNGEGGNGQGGHGGQGGEGSSGGEGGSGGVWNTGGGGSGGSGGSGGYGGSGSGGFGGTGSGGFGGSGGSGGAVPEPGTYALFLAAAYAAIILRRRPGA